ncbi:MAG: hypothetical protein SGILL_006311 [Bacillariaceae sp.]
MAIFAPLTRHRFRPADSTSPKKRRIPALAHLCRRRAFDDIVEILQDPTATVERKWFETEYTLMGENALHFIMRFHPPANVVSAMITRLRETAGISQPELCVDLLGKSPLHHACANQCEPSVIHTLLRTPAGVISARAQDLQGRLPLHLLCKSYQSSRKRSEKALARDTAALSNMLVGIKLLVGLSPRTACVKDDKGRVPLDYVKNMKMDEAKKADNMLCELWESMKIELSIAMDLSTSTAASISSGISSGMVIKFATDNTVTDDDDVSVLSFAGEQ